MTIYAWELGNSFGDYLQPRLFGVPDLRNQLLICHLQVESSSAPKLCVLKRKMNSAHLSKNTLYSSFIIAQLSEIYYHSLSCQSYNLGIIIICYFFYSSHLKNNQQNLSTLKTALKLSLILYPYVIP